MRTPAGKECPYFFGDYYRGRTREECRLLSTATPSLPWKANLCKTCPVPEIALANACPDMVLQPGLERPLPLMPRQVKVHTYCNRSGKRGFDEHTGCGECHILPAAFSEDQQ